MAISKGDLGVAKAIFVICISIALLLTVNAVNCTPHGGRHLLYSEAISAVVKSEAKVEVKINDTNKSDPGCGKEVGSVVKIGGLKSYVSGPSHSKYAVVLASDVFGYEVPNLRKIADKVGAAGYYAVVPDFFYGDAFNSSIKNLTEWRAQHPAAKAFKASKPVIKALKRKGISAIAAAGFCYGDVKVPVEILGGANDVGVSPTVIKKYEEILSSRPEIPRFVKIFPGVGHGWTTRYNSTTEKAAEEAHQDLLNWVNKYIKHKKKA
ncbi:hypothetical protein BUALT_Bualt13G0011200 [Buddleja alternifolia]|uniref:Dienelactone hydrolase domain-containing protein n=1 Tax=Buddleja alternifolia TaxID=168488 RepID=A0AAV6WHU5_9LAMI|nr:hypothetical protein BUALT_Bualt13G0011200 [Buddleja alternifolia]